jgi:N-acetyl-gamma-glutamylphosphate reductase
MGKTAIVLGATGLTGNLLLNLLIEDTNYSKIKLFSRSTVNKKTEKIEEHLVDLLELEKQKKRFHCRRSLLLHWNNSVQNKK